MDLILFCRKLKKKKIINSGIELTPCLLIFTVFSKRFWFSRIQAKVLLDIFVFVMLSLEILHILLECIKKVQLLLKAYLYRITMILISLALNKVQCGKSGIHIIYQSAGLWMWRMKKFPLLEVHFDYVFETDQRMSYPLF